MARGPGVTSPMESKRNRVHPVPQRRPARLEIAALAATLLSYIWLWKGSFPGNVPIVLVLYFGIGIEGHIRRRETARDVGIRLDNVAVACRTVLPWIGPILVAIAVVGVLLHGWHPPRALLGSVIWHLGWGIVQQYGLLCIFYRRLREIFSRAGAAEVAGGLIFALFHLPNPFLAPLAAVLGTLACWLYRREPNLLVLGVAHGLVGFMLTHALPGTLTWMMRVGPAVLKMW